MKNFLKRNKNTPLVRGVRKTRYSWHLFSGKVESAYEEMVELAIQRTIRVTERIKLLNLIKLLTFLAVIYVFIFTIINKNARTGLVFAHDTMNMRVVILGFVVLGANILYTLWQIYLTLRYKVYKPQSDEKLPTCVIIVPAYNEGKQVYPSLMSILKSDYPADKLEIVTINDGSSDDTLEWMNKAAKDSKGRIKVIDLEKNQGKRNAIYQGVLN